MKTWDGVPLDTTLTLPAAGRSGLPLVVEIHGLGNSKYEYLDPASTAYTDNAYAWARAGYAVLTYTARGFWGSCGTPESRAANPGPCARGYTHLADSRYEARDTQHLIGRLVDEGVADRARLGVTGDSYGGGQSLMLAALNDRTMLPDGRLVPWRSPAGIRLGLAGAAPVIPWSDLIYAVAPNGSTLTNAIAPGAAPGLPVGVEKASLANGVFAAAQVALGPGQPVGQPFVPGRPIGYIVPPRVDPEADVTTWIGRASAGPPYTEPLARSIVGTLQRNHSAYGIDSSRAPAPLFLGSGFTDDLFPTDEVIRFFNRTLRQHPRTPLSMLLGDFGHMRASNKRDVRALLLRDVHAWLDHHVRGRGAAPRTGVTALTQTCPRNADSGGPFSAARFHALARGEVRGEAENAHTILPGGGNPLVSRAVDPVAGGGDACATTPAADQPAALTLRLRRAPANGYTLLGAPTVVARFELTGSRDTAQLAARLWDVGPGGSSQTLVARGLYRPAGRRTEVFQLHPNGYRFGAGHVPKLELLGDDLPYGRPSNAPFAVRASHLQLRLPVRDEPDCRTVFPASVPVVPAGQRLAPGVPAGPGEPCARRSSAPVGDAPPSARDRAADRATGSSAGATAAGATRTAPDGRSLPFTGFELAALIGAALALGSTGVVLRARLRR